MMRLSRTRRLRIKKRWRRPPNLSQVNLYLVPLGVLYGLVTASSSFLTQQRGCPFGEKPEELEDNDKVDDIVEKGPPSKQSKGEYYDQILVMSTCIR